MKQALEGVKVADFSWVGVGPIIARILAHHGATVVHIESETTPDPLRALAPYKDNISGLNRCAYHACLNDGKYGATLNLRHPMAKGVVERFVKWADIVSESFVPGVAARLGISYEDVRKVKPDIIMYSSCNLGQTGPRAKFRGFGTNLVALVGTTHLTGWPDRMPTPPYGALTDSIAPLFGAAALVAALDYHRKTGKGQYLDLSQFESTVHFLTPLILDYQASGRVAQRTGNTSPYTAPHGAYPCKGEDRWCAIAVLTPEEWKAFCKVIGNPDWTKDPRFSTVLARKRNEEELNRLIGEWTIGLSAEEVMVKMQEAGIAAGVVETPATIQDNPQLRHRHHYRALEHPEIGLHHYDAAPFTLSKTPCDLNMPGPCLGQHNEYVYTKILGMSDEEFVELLAEGVFE